MFNIRGHICNAWNSNLLLDEKLKSYDKLIKRLVYMTGPLTRVWCRWLCLTACVCLFSTILMFYTSACSVWVCLWCCVQTLQRDTAISHYTHLDGPRPLFIYRKTLVRRDAHTHKHTSCRGQ